MAAELFLISDNLHHFDKVSGKDIAENMRVPFFYCPVMTWIPVVEPDLGQERFLEDEPNKLFRDGNFPKVNIIIGITEIEYTSPVAGLSNLPTVSKFSNSLPFQKF